MGCAMVGLGVLTPALAQHEDFLDQGWNSRGGSAGRPDRTAGKSSPAFSPELPSGTLRAQECFDFKMEILG